ncbi:MAG: amidohydrolase [Fervidobacterium sp.]
MILIENATIITLQSEKVLKNSDLVISGDKIIYIGPKKSYQFTFEKTIDGTDFIVMPGFANTHSHLAMTFFRGYGNDLPLKKWLFNYIFPVEEMLTEEHVYFGTLIACIESIRTGTTTLSDFYMMPEKSIKAIKEAGLRANVGYAFASKPGLNRITLKKAEKFFNDFNGIENNRILASLAPHATYTCTNTLLSETSKLAQNIGALIQIHLHETREEVEDYKKKNGKTPILKLDEIGFFNAKVLASHCVHITDEETKALKDNKVGVSVNPQSNLKLGSGIPKIHNLLREGVKLSIGTDGPSSNNNLSVLEDLRLTSLLAKGLSENPEVLNSFEALKIGTINGEENLGFKDVGVLKEGYKADLIMINKKKTNFMPETDYLSHVVYSMFPADVDYVFVDGKLIMEMGKILTLDEEILKKEFIKLSKELYKSSPQ